MSAQSFKIGTPLLIEKAYGEKYGLCRIPGIVCTEKKTILCYYEARSDFSDWAKIDIKVVRSTNEGESFEDVLCIEGDGDTMNNPVMIADKDTVHFLYCRNYNRLYYRRSTDDGETFSEPRDITDVLTSDGTSYTVAATGPGHGIVHNGRIMVPLWYGYNEMDAKAHSPTNVRTVYSEDGGETWKLGETVWENHLDDANESALAVTPEGKVLISIRHKTDNGAKRALAVSSDGISGWSAPELYDQLPDARCMGSMAYDENAVYHINCASTRAREDLTIKISRDCFESYDSIEVSKYAGYSDIAVRGNSIYVFYERFHEAFHAKWNPKVKTERDEFDGLYFVKIKLQ